MVEKILTLETAEMLLEDIQYHSTDEEVKHLAEKLESKLRTGTDLPRGHELGEYQK